MHLYTRRLCAEEVRLKTHLTLTANSYLREVLSHLTIHGTSGIHYWHSGGANMYATKYNRTTAITSDPLNLEDLLTIRLISPVDTRKRCFMSLTQSTWQLPGRGCTDCPHHVPDALLLPGRPAPVAWYWLRNRKKSIFIILVYTPSHAKPVPTCRRRLKKTRGGYFECCTYRIV